MKTIVPSTLKGTKVYFTDADRAAQRRACLSQQTLEEKIKLLCLLNDHVVIATSHIFESSLTYQAILKNRLLLESGIILPALRDTCRDFQDFIEHKQLEYERVGAYKGKQGQAVANFLQVTAEATVSWELQATREAFKASLLRDLSAPDSLLHKELSLSKEQQEALLARLSAIETISREEVTEVTQGLPDTVQSQLFHYVDLNYYLAGASAVESDPVVGTLEDVQHVRDKIERAASVSEQLGSDTRLFRELLTSLYVSADILGDLTDRDIIKLRQDSVIGEFRRCYRTIIENVRRSLPELTGLTDDMKRLAHEAKQIMGSYIREELRRELAREQSARKIAQAIQISGYATALISLLSLPLLPPSLQAVAQVSGAMGTALQLADPLLQKILVEPKRGELILFAARLLELTRKYG